MGPPAEVGIADLGIHTLAAAARSIPSAGPARSILRAQENHTRSPAAAAACGMVVRRRSGTAAVSEVESPMVRR